MLEKVSFDVPLTRQTIKVLVGNLQPVVVEKRVVGAHVLGDDEEEEDDDVVVGVVNRLVVVVVVEVVVVVGA